MKSNEKKALDAAVDRILAYHPKKTEKRHSKGQLNMSIPRMELVRRLSLQLTEISKRTGRIDYHIFPSIKVDVSDIDSLKSAKYHVRCEAISEWLDIEELVSLVRLVSYSDLHMEIEMTWKDGRMTEEKRTIDEELSDAVILRIAPLLNFSYPELPR